MKDYTIRLLDEEGCTIAEQAEFTTNSVKAIVEAKLMLKDDEYNSEEVYKVEVLDDSGVIWDKFSMKEQNQKDIEYDKILKFEQVMPHLERGGQVYRNIRHRKTNRSDQFYYKLKDGGLRCKVNQLGGWNKSSTPIDPKYEYFANECEYYNEDLLPLKWNEDYKPIKIILGSDI